MSGRGDFPIQPSQIGLGAIVSTQSYEGIPTPGAQTLGIPAVNGQPTCSDLAAASPPTILEEFQIYSYTIGIGILSIASGGSFAEPPNFTVGLGFQINGRLVYKVSQIIPPFSPAVGEAIASGQFISDLVNPIHLERSQRLSLQITLTQDQDATATTVFVGTQAEIVSGGAAPVPMESSVSYNVIELPASRRL